MCGRFTLTSEPEGVRKRFYVPDTFRETRLVPSFNIAPSHEVAVVLNGNDGCELDSFRWGLIPSWVKDLTKMKPIINARLETIAEKPFFKSALTKRRCLIPADGFYEWVQEPGNKTKTPMFIHLPGRPMFGFAGLWDQWTNSDGEVIRTCTIVTMAANEVMQPVHDRMPAILSLENEVAWLDESRKDPAELIELLGSCRTQHFEMHPVSTRVNSPRTNAPELIAQLLPN
jgi:putative SOS response-associated peptidase YedK